MTSESLEILKKKHDIWYAKYLKKRETKVKRIEKLINTIWWRLNRIEWDHDRQTIKIFAEDQGGWPFEAFSFGFGSETWLHLLELTLKKVKKLYSK